MKKELLRKIPKIDEILSRPEIIAAIESGSRSCVIDGVRAVTAGLRVEILAGGEPDISPENVSQLALLAAATSVQMSLRPVINATGIVLHTNLGRAVMCHDAAVAAMDVAENYNTLEYSCAEGRRGSRYSHVESLLCRLTGAESAIVVNNNAAAVMLILGTMAKDAEVIVSRGELVEIGGSFRVPEIMEQSNSTLVEVGTTNKTHPEDYARAITEKTGALLKVHTSNYKIMGFTEEVSLEEMAAIGKRNKIPTLYDLGSGALVNLPEFGITDEPTVKEAMASGVDVVCFSGDKLLGGPQAGIILGAKAAIDAMKKNPLTRAVRIDKLTLAALEATLRIYLDPESVAAKIPTYAMLSQTMETLLSKAKALGTKIAQKSPTLGIEIIEDEGQVGGGSVPTQMIKTAAVAISCGELSVSEVEKRLRFCKTPIIARISKDRLILDTRTIDEKHFEYIAEAFAEMLI